MSLHAIYLCQENWFGPNNTQSTDPTGGRRMPRFIAYSPMMDLTVPAALQGVTTLILCDVLLQILNFFLDHN
jgi:hypothetical protein